MRKNIFFIGLFWLIALSLVGCGSKHKLVTTTEKVVQKQTNATETETGTRTTITKGDSIIFIPKIVYKNDTITKVHENIIQRVIYRNGAVSKVTCEQQYKEVIENYLKKRNEQVTEQVTEKKEVKEKDKTASPIKDVYFLYLGIIYLISVWIKKPSKNDNTN